MKLLERIALAGACLCVTAALAAGAPKIDLTPPSLKGPLSDLPSFYPQECREETEQRWINDEAHARSKAWELLKGWGYSSWRTSTDKENQESFRIETIDKMKSTGEFFTIQRLEVSGIWTNADAEPPFRDRFDAFLHPSYLGVVDKIAEENSSWIPKVLFGLTFQEMLAIAAAKDLMESRAEMGGQLTETGKFILQPLKDNKDAYINEIVAHSWGSDIVYNGILEGYIRPPKRIILIGVPNPYVTKWLELAKRLPIDVKVYSSKEDIVSNKVNSKWTKWVMHNAAGYSQDFWKQKVDEYCNRRDSECDKPRPGSFHSAYCGTFLADVDAQLVHAGPAGHARLAYYDYVKTQGELSDTVEQMNQDQEEAVTAKMNEMFDKAMAEARYTLKQSPYETITRQICRNMVVHETPPIPVLQPFIPPAYKPYEELYSLATAACLNPYGLTEEGMRRHLSGFPDRQSYSLSLNIPPGCVRDLFSELLQFNAAGSPDTLNRNWLVGEAMQFNQRHAPSYPSSGGGGQSGPAYSGPCGNGGSLCGNNRPHFNH